MAELTEAQKEYIRVYEERAEARRVQAVWVDAQEVEALRDGRPVSGLTE